jgi:16S rRNA (cytosine967-C5)-methyltransferase
MRCSARASRSRRRSIRATQGIDRSDDRGLAHAIAAETLRRLPDLDALIDSATQRRLARRCQGALRAAHRAGPGAGALGTPGHAAISTVLPLVDGGPRKLVHGVFGTLMRQGASLPEPPDAARSGGARWHAAWGDQMVEDAERAIAVPPPLDLTLARSGARARDAAASRLLPGHIRLDEKRSGHRHRRVRRRRLVGAGSSPPRFLPG